MEGRSVSIKLWTHLASHIHVGSLGTRAESVWRDSRVALSEPDSPLEQRDSVDTSAKRRRRKRK